MRTKPFAVILAVHVLLVIVLHEAVTTTFFCMWIRPEWIQEALILCWVLLTLSPILGLVAIKFERLRVVYLVLAGLMVAQFIGVMMMNHFGVLICDAP